MAEILIFMQDRIGDDVPRNAKLPKRGDVVTVQADGWPWGTAELGDPMFRVVALPGVAVSTLTDLLSWEVPTDPNITIPSDLTNTLQYRGFNLNLALASTLPVAARNFLADDTRATPILTVSAGAARNAFLALKQKKAAIANAAVIGKSKTVVG